MSDDSEEAEEVLEWPLKEWKDIPLEKMVDDGWKPRRKIVGEHEYITIRFGSQERGLGRFSPAKWTLLHERFPTLKRGRPSKIIKKEAQASVLQTRVKKPTVIPKHVYPSLTTLKWFEILKQNGYEGDFNDFMNEIIETHFSKCHGLHPIIIYREGG